MAEEAYKKNKCGWYLAIDERTDEIDKDTWQRMKEGVIFEGWV